MGASTPGGLEETTATTREKEKEETEREIKKERSAVASSDSSDDYSRMATSTISQEKTFSLRLIKHVHMHMPTSLNFLTAYSQSFFDN